MNKHHMSAELIFPKGFLFGTATSSYQIEGAALEDGRGPSIWDAFCRQLGAVVNFENGDVACDHYNRLEQDLDMIQQLGMQAYRFSVAWPRVIPEGRGAVNELGLDFYDRLVDGLLKRGIEPHVTLYHWDLPLALHQTGGWTIRSTAEAFCEYAGVVAGRLGDRVKSYSTLNEPFCSAILGYFEGVHAPGLQDMGLAMRAVHHLLLGHGLALEATRAKAPAASHGIVLNFTPGYPADDSEDAHRATRLHDLINNRLFADPILSGKYPADLIELWSAGYGDNLLPIQQGDMEIISRPLDFLGINYYTRHVLTSLKDGDTAQFNMTTHDPEVTDMDWAIYPLGLTELLLRLQREYLLPPLFIMENGMACRDELHNGVVRDGARVSYLNRHLAALLLAMARGVQVKGYFAWSLMDNFEWAWGYEKRFGLVYVDYETLERTPKQSALWYRDVIAANFDAHKHSEHSSGEALCPR